MRMPEPKKLHVAALKNGTVIDHIESKQALKIVDLLDLKDTHEKIITIGINLPSKSKGTKDLIKIEDWELTLDEGKRIALLSPGATVNIIKNYAVIKKFILEVPTHITRLIICPNGKCITNHEPMDSFFYLTQTNKTLLTLTCKYCERTFLRKEIKDYRT